MYENSGFWGFGARSLFIKTNKHYYEVHKFKVVIATTIMEMVSKYGLVSGLMVIKVIHVWRV